jgi:hypothetical protein
MHIERIIEAENIAEGGFNKEEGGVVGGGGSSAAVFVNDLDNKTTKEKMLRQLVEWAKHIPHFSDLKVEDQVSFFLNVSIMCTIIVGYRGVSGGMALFRVGMKGWGGRPFSSQEKENIYYLGNFGHFAASKVLKYSEIAQNSLMGSF